MKGFIVYPTYRITEGKAQVLLYGRLENGESFVTINDFKPYIWIRHADKDKALAILKEMKAENISIDDSHFRNFKHEPVCKVTLSIPRDVPELKKRFNDSNIICYEADIRFSYRFMIDHKLKACMEIEGDAAKDEGLFVDNVFMDPKLSPAEYAPELKVLSIDIETDMKASRIFCISLYSRDIKKVLIHKEGSFEDADSFSTEKEMLEAFAAIVISYDPDIITGWNLIDFDIKVLRDQFRKCNIPFILGRSPQECSIKLTDSFFMDSSANFPGRSVIDGLRLLKMSFIRLEDYKLNTAAKAILGEEKLIIEEDKVKEIEDLYKGNPQKLIDYNLKDSELVYNILEKSKALELSIKRSILTRMQLDRVNASIASLDSLYLAELKERKIVAPTAFVNERAERIKGGFVMESKPGIYTGIIVLDFKSLYPSLIRTFNIDPFSFIPHEDYANLSEKEQKKLVESPNKAHFRNEDGILPQLIQHLWEQRDIAKRNKDALASQAIKILMNSFFGVLANPTCRFYSLEMANAITHFGQFFNKLTARKIGEKGYEVIYGDTDSIFVNTTLPDTKKAEFIGEELQAFVNAFYKEYVRKNYDRHSYLELEFDRAFSRFLMPHVRGSEVGAKKRYAGIVTEDGKEKIVIVGMEFVRRDWTELSKRFQMDLLDHIFHDKPLDFYIKSFIDELRKGRMDDLLIYRKAIRKGVSEYTKTTPPHIKAARKLGREAPGIIEYVMTMNGPEPLGHETAKLDYEHYIDKQLKPIAESVLSFQNRTFDDFMTKHKQTSLSNF